MCLEYPMTNPERIHEPSTNPLSKLSFTKKVAKRAQYEAFEFTLVPEGVGVRNGSHANPEEHEYLVTIGEGTPQTCTCPVNARFAGACKHRVAVAIHHAPFSDG
jgi:hypothetical protein